MQLSTLLLGTIALLLATTASVSASPVPVPAPAPQRIIDSYTVSEAEKDWGKWQGDPRFFSGTQTPKKPE